MLELNIRNITIDHLTIPILSEKNISIDVLRLDKVHPIISGNKLFKLRYYINDALLQNKKTIVTFGGAWSNHIVATAAASKLYNIKSIGIIRGEKAESLSNTLLQAEELGMNLIFISRNDYQNKIVPVSLIAPENYFIAEGGYGNKGAKGASTILENIQLENYTTICCAAGTGTMTAGLLNGITINQNIITISVLKNYLELEEKIIGLTPGNMKQLTIFNDYHFGGYAKKKPELIHFINEFYHQTAIPTDFVYTGKLFYAIMDLIKKDYFPANSKLLIVHSGGLQGNSSLSKGTLIF